MIIVMQFGAPTEAVDAVCRVIRSRGIDPLVMPGEDRLAIGIPASLSIEDREFLESVVGSMPEVSKVTQTSSPYKLASIEFHRDRTVVEAGPNKIQIGDGGFTVMAGPCSVESYEQFKSAAAIVKGSGAQVLRGGAFKPRTSPYSFQGLQLEGLKIIKQVGEETGLATISEVMSADMVDTVGQHVDILQIGARSMQNFPLLIEAGKSQLPVFLKRGPSATIDEFLLAAEYVLSQGNPRVILCERGVMPLDKTYTRNTLDLSAVPVLKAHTHLPVIVDPSHGTGVARYVAPMALAALVCGADGVMVEMHPDPMSALSDGSQALTPDKYSELTNRLAGLSRYMSETQA
ncbi:MAG: 3-deoxy-7-phosphoheptulonate synthase [Chthonomonadaceae bacterium]|nr:3-deoxy-7-phosphoheptulonate synthase [Chthonomonadaceae bacterium]